MLVSELQLRTRDHFYEGNETEKPFSLDDADVRDSESVLCNAAAAAASHL
jgi:hypothetical protein